MVTALNTCPLPQVARLRRDLAAARQEKVMVETVGSDRDKQVHQVSRGRRNFDRCLCLKSKQCTFQVTNRLTKVEHDLQEKEALVSRLQEAASRSQEDRRRLESQLEEKVKLVDKRENTIKKLSGEIIKANEIIAKLQVEKI